MGKHEGNISYARREGGGWKRGKERGVDQNSSRRKNSGRLFEKYDRDPQKIDALLEATLRAILIRNLGRMRIGHLFTLAGGKLGYNITKGGRSTPLSRWLKDTHGNSVNFLRKYNKSFSLESENVNSTSVNVYLKDFKWINTTVTTTCAFWSPTGGWGRLQILESPANPNPNPNPNINPNPSINPNFTVFVHHTGLDKTIETRRLNIGDKVKARISLGHKGLFATSVTLESLKLDRHTLKAESHDPNEEDSVGMGEFPDEGREYKAECLYWSYKGKWGKLRVIPFNEEVFCHTSQFRGKYKTLRIGEQVRCKVFTSNSSSGFEARDIRVIKSSLLSKKATSRPKNFKFPPSRSRKDANLPDVPDVNSTKPSQPVGECG
ncbi:hypothetical protein AAMO2058_001440500 [Amorphochlora amoebiformis]